MVLLEGTEMAKTSPPTKLLKRLLFTFNARFGRGSLLRSVYLKQRKVC